VIKLSVVALELSAVLGVVFGLLAAACAFVISYNEYKRNWSFRGSATKMALRSALVTFVFFFLAAIGLAAILRAVLR
jgi:multisubunit Na+/H+ antiporter MnhG subunit